MGCRSGHRRVSVSQMASERRQRSRSNRKGKPQNAKLKDGRDYKSVCWILGRLTSRGLANVVLSGGRNGQKKRRQSQRKSSVHPSNLSVRSRKTCGNLSQAVPSRCGIPVPCPAGPVDKLSWTSCLLDGNTTALNVLPKIIQSNHMFQLRTYHASSSTLSSNVR